LGSFETLESKVSASISKSFRAISDTTATGHKLPVTFLALLEMLARFWQLK
jgi:hypothetical protein